MPKAVLQRKLDDLETARLIQEIKYEAEEIEKRRRIKLSMGNSSRAPSSEKGTSRE